MTDTKSKALWLKQNPILAAGAVHIARMLTTNTCLQTLDLLNTGLLDEDCETLFSALKVNQSLKHVSFDANGLTVRSGRIIREHFEQQHNHLETLNLACNALDDALIGHKTLKKLHLGVMKSTNLLGHVNNVIKDDGAGQISRLIQFNHPIHSTDRCVLQQYSTTRIDSNKRCCKHQSNVDNTEKIIIATFR